MDISPRDLTENRNAREIAPPQPARARVAAHSRVHDLELQSQFIDLSLQQRRERLRAIQPVTRSETIAQNDNRFRSGRRASGRDARDIGRD